MTGIEPPANIVDEAVQQAVPDVSPAGSATVPGPPAAPVGTVAAPQRDLPDATGTPVPAPARRVDTARERRRQETRERIVDAAADLFAERGFDQVSVVQIARRAGVVEKTVFNHFPVKEGLVFDADPPMRAALVSAVRRRPADEPAAVAAGRFVVAAVSQLGSPRALGAVAEMARVIRGSRTLVVREREILGTLTDALAAEIRRETGARPGDLEPWLTAHAVLGLYAALLDLARDRALTGAAGAELTEELQASGRRGLELLQYGLAGR